MKYKVFLQQYVEEVAVVEIEADDPEEARDKVLEQHRKDWASIKWEAGYDSYAADCYAVKDMDNNELWER